MKIEIINNEYVVKSTIIKDREYKFETLESAKRFLTGRNKKVTISNRTSSPTQFMKYLEQ